MGRAIGQAMGRGPESRRAGRAGWRIARGCLVVGGDPWLRYTVGPMAPTARTAFWRRLAPVFLPGAVTRPAVCALLAVVTATGGMGCGGPRTALSLRRVVLYQNGIGYFERSGEVRDPIYRLRLRSHEIDDVLKSLVVISETGGGEQRPVTAVIPQPRAARPSDAASASARGGTSGATAEDRSELLIDTGASTGDGLLGRPQRLTIAYTTPSPVWKSAYRIVLPGARRAVGDGSPAASAGDGVLQAWAIVDNLSGESWDGVELILATGAPLTFALDLRAPRFVPRPDITGQLVTPAATSLVLAEATRTSPVAATDSDRDGIPDSQDKCPNEPETYNGTEDSDGCPDRGRVIISQSSIQILDQLFFKRDSVKLEPNTRPMIEAIAATLKGNPDLSLIEVAGHACGDSSPRDISQSRADAVRGALVALGVEGRRLRARGYGGDQPLSAGTSEEACGRNRRVQINILQRREEAPSPSPATAPGPVTAAHVAASARPLSTLQESLGGARYRLSGPVTLPEGSSTMVSLLTLRGGSEDIYLFRPDGSVAGSDRHPLRAARVHVGSPLEPGPVAVFAGGGFVGEGVLGRVAAGETALIPYALDRAVSVQQSSHSSARPLRLLSVRGGQAQVQDEQVVETRYQITLPEKSVETPARLFVRHPRRVGFDALALPAESEASADAYLVPQTLTSEGSTGLAVRERRLESTVRSLREARNESHHLCPYIGSGAAQSGIPADAEARLSAICQQQRAILAADRESERLHRQRDEQEERGNELRDNLRAVEKIVSAAGLRAELLAKLTEHERRSAELQKRLVSLSETTATAEAKLAQLLADFSVEVAAP